MTKTILAWIDLETTGLKAESGRILEYAVVLTDLELNELASLTNIIPQNVGVARTMMDDYVTEMHTSNGLLEELEAAEGNAPQYGDSIEEADQTIAALLQRVTLMKATDPTDIIRVISGNTIGFDRLWIVKDMPILCNSLHYRQLDVSSYKVGFPELFGVATSVAHRAMADIRASIAQQERMRMIVTAGVKALADKGVLLGV